MNDARRDQLTFVVLAEPRCDADSLRACLRSIDAEAGRPRRVLVIADEEFEEEARETAREFPAEIVAAHRAETAGARRNLALRAARTEFLVFLSAQAAPREGWLNPLLAEMQGHPEVAAAGGVTAQPVTGKILHAGIAIAADSHPVYLHREEYLAHLSDLTLSARPAAVSADFMIARRSTLEAVGGFDERFRGGYDDVDLCLRLRAAGHDVALCTASVALHDEPSRLATLAHRRASLNLLRETVESLPAQVRASLDHQETGELPHRARRPLVSVLYPAFNDEKFLEENIESIINQTYRHWELLIADDASTDGRTPAILDAYGEAYPGQIRISHRHAHDRVAAWEELYEAAGGEYLCIMGADDVFLPRKLERQVRAIEENPSWSFVQTDVYRFDEAGALIDRLHIEDPPPQSQILRLLKQNYVSTPSVLMRRDAVERAGGWMKREFLYAQDYDLWLRLLRVGAAGCLHEPLLKYRIHRAQLSQVVGTEMVNRGIGVVRDKLARWQPADLFPALDFDSVEGATAYYTEAGQLFFAERFADDDVQLALLGFFEKMGRVGPAHPAVRRARGEFFYRVGYHFFLRRRHALALRNAARALTADPSFVPELFKIFMRRARRARSASAR